MKLNTEKIIARKDGKIGWMIINNPEKRNAIISKFADEIRRLATKHETYLSDFFAPKDINRRKVELLLFLKRF